MTTEEKKEFEKCEADPVYFHNKYMKYPGKRILTKKEYYDQIAMINVKLHMQRSRARHQIVTTRKLKEFYPMTPDQSFKIIT
jgi:hypothetical protein